MDATQALYFNALLKNLHKNKPGMSVQGLIYISFILANYEIGKTKLVDLYTLVAKEYDTTPAACERAVRRWFKAVDLQTLADFVGIDELTDARSISIIPLLKAAIQ
jgi:hypothetical protein